MAKGLGEYSLKVLTASEVASGSGDIFGGIFGEGEGMEIAGLLVRAGGARFMKGSTTDCFEKFHAEVKR